MTEPQEEQHQLRDVFSAERILCHQALPNWSHLIGESRITMQFQMLWPSSLGSALEKQKTRIPGEGRWNGFSHSLEIGSLTPGQCSTTPREDPDTLGEGSQRNRHRTKHSTMLDGKRLVANLDCCHFCSIAISVRQREIRTWWMRMRSSPRLTNVIDRAWTHDQHVHGSQTLDLEVQNAGFGDPEFVSKVGITTGALAGISALLSMGQKTETQRWKLSCFAQWRSVSWILHVDMLCTSSVHVDLHHDHKHAKPETLAKRIRIKHFKGPPGTTATSHRASSATSMTIVNPTGKGNSLSTNSMTWRWQTSNGNGCTSISQPVFCKEAAIWTNICKLQHNMG